MQTGLNLFDLDKENAAASAHRFAVHVVERSRRCTALVSIDVTCDLYANVVSVRIHGEHESSDLSDECAVFEVAELYQRTYLRAVL